MPAKRKLPQLGVERRVRPRREEEWEPEADGSDASSDDDVSEEGIQDDEEDDNDDGASSQGSGSDSESSENETLAKPDFSSISFGALARAQASLPPSERQGKKQKRAGATDEEDDRRSSKNDRSTAKNSKTAPKPKRSSKHAPQEQSSKRPVSRMREVVTETKRAPARDPRFDPLSTGGSRRFDEAKIHKAYAFLDEYRDKELADLRVEAKKTKDPARKEELKRKIMSMESRKKARKQKEEQQQLLDEHRRREKDLVAQGKQPFYLKKSEQKKKLLTDRFEKMSKGQVDRAIERKRKKVAGKEKKELGSLQRVTDRHSR